MERQPLLEKQGYAIAVPLPPQALLERRRRRSPPPHAVLLPLLLLVLATVHFLVRPLWSLFGSPSTPPTLSRGESVPLSGPLELTSPRCLIYNTYSGSRGGVFRPPPATYPLSFGAGRNLTVRQTVSPPDRDSVHENEHWRRVHTEGEIVVRRADSAHAAGAAVVELLYNDEHIRATVTTVPGDDQALYLHTDGGFWTDEPTVRGHPCLLARITVWVPGKVDGDNAFHLDHLTLDAVNLGLKLTDGLNLAVASTARLHTVAADVVTAARLPPSEFELAFIAAPTAVSTSVPAPASKSVARPAFRFVADDVEVHLVSGDVHGPWVLRHSLFIETVSGDVHIEVEEQGVDATDEDDLPLLRLRTVSGDIKLLETPSTAARPGHRLAVDTRSGSVSVSDAVFAGSAHAHAVSGDLCLDLRVLAPPADSNKSAVLETATVSGHASVDLTYADGDGQQPLGFLHSKHRAVSGDIDLHYPAAWNGFIRLNAWTSGSVSVTGKDVHVLPDNRPHFPPHLGHRIEATKGAADNTSTIDAEATSGSIRLSFPE